MAAVSNNECKIQYITNANITTISVKEVLCAETCSVFSTLANE